MFFFVFFLFWHRELQAKVIFEFCELFGFVMHQTEKGLLIEGERDENITLKFNEELLHIFDNVLIPVSKSKKKKTKKQKKRQIQKQNKTN